jgi:hypothetical protein
LLEEENGIIPIEVKAGINTKAKSLAVYMGKYPTPESILLSGAPLIRNQKGNHQLPLYLASQIQSYLKMVQYASGL